MKNGKERFVETSKKGGAIVALALWIGGNAAMDLRAQNSATLVQPERQAATMQSKFYCNIKALTPEERGRHKQMSEKLIAARKEIVESGSPGRVQVDQVSGRQSRGESARRVPPDHWY